MVFHAGSLLGIRLHYLDMLGYTQLSKKGCVILYVLLSRPFCLTFENSSHQFPVADSHYPLPMNFLPVFSLVTARVPRHGCLLSSCRRPHHSAGLMITSRHHNNFWSNGVCIRAYQNFRHCVHTFFCTTNTSFDGVHNLMCGQYLQVSPFVQTQ